MLFNQESPEETASRFDTGKDPNPPFPSTNLFVQALLDVGRAQPPTVCLGQHYHTHGVLETFLETGDGLGGNLLLKARDDGGQGPASLREIGGLKDPLDVRGPLPPMAARRMSPEVTQERNLAALSGDPRERLAGRFDETPVALSEITHKTPFKPRPFNPLKKSSQAAKDSESPISRPNPRSRDPGSPVPRRRGCPWR